MSSAIDSGQVSAGLHLCSFGQRRPVFYGGAASDRVADPTAHKSEEELECLQRSTSLSRETTGDDDVRGEFMDPVNESRRSTLDEVLY